MKNNSNYIRSSDARRHAALAGNEYNVAQLGSSRVAAAGRNVYATSERTTTRVRCRTVSTIPTSTCEECALKVLLFMSVHE